jgi:hypothetical protein
MGFAQLVFMETGEHCMEIAVLIKAFVKFKGILRLWAPSELSAQQLPPL